MRTAVYQGADKPLKIEDVPVPRAHEGEIVFKVDACGICASDLHAAESGLCPPGVTFGHEYTGRVAEIGPGVDGWSVGDRMIALPGKPCGTCPACQEQRYLECKDLILQGFDPRMPGAYADYATTMAMLAMKVPAEVPPRTAAVIEPLAVGLGACNAARLSAGNSVLVIGAGIIGLAVAKWARFFGAAAVGISEMLPARIERARATGVDVVIDAAACDDPVAEFRRQTGREPAFIFECVGRPMIHKLIEMAPTGAELVMVGTGMEPEKFTVLSAAMKRLRMTFVLGYEPVDFPFVLEMLARGRIDADGLVTGTVGLEDLPEMFARLQKPNDHCKVLVEP